MQRTTVVTAMILLCAAASVAQEMVATPLPDPAALPGRDAMRTLEVEFAGRAVLVPRLGARIEVIPVLALVGATTEFSMAAGTYLVSHGDRVLQFSPGHRMVLVDGELFDSADAPVPSPGGVAASIEFVDRSMLAPLGFRLEPSPTGYRIVTGARLDPPLTVRPAAADFAATTTLVLSLERAVGVTVEPGADDGIVIRFAGATPRLDPTARLQSRRVRVISSRADELIVDTAADVGLLSWHRLDGPPRVILEIGQVVPTPTPVPAQSLERTGPQPIVIDPGHGGKDTGAVSDTGLTERDLTMAVARRLAVELRAQGHTVRLTRDDGEGRALTDRTAIANRLEARVFVSLHANASSFSSAKGSETYYMSLDDRATDAASAALAELENTADTSPDGRSDLDLILWDLAQASVLNESAELAVSVQTRLNELLEIRDRGVKQAPFVVLTGATMPAILVEVGFLSNPAEASRLASPEHQQALAGAIATGIEAFLRDR
jgi:N-acetylmuramoyl-L-alanine amidase